MSGKQQTKEDVVFGLDIGTRNVVGVIGYMDRDRFKITAMAQVEHETRAMLDGQIHDIYKVGDTIRKVKLALEKKVNIELTDVCIAAAGRVLKTVNADAVYDFDEETRVTQEHIYSLDLLAVENAHNTINADSGDTRFFCVGSTPVRYELNGYDINNLEGHKAHSIAVSLIATFLPEEVVDGLYEAVEYAGLKVANLTLEPIAAMNIAIPVQYRLLNIGLIDVGAGTSDICITKDGCVVAYGMIPSAGDELTERIAKTYLMDFNTAEKVKVSASAKKKGLVTFKDIMGITQKVDALEIRKSVEDVVENMAKEVADKIIELNGGKPVNAVFVVGGGGKIPGYTDKVADCLGIAHQRVAVRGEEVLTSVDFEIEDFKKDSLYVTPVGICTNYYTQKNNFVFVTVNNERIKLYDTSNLTVVDAVMQVGFPNEKLFPRRGEQLSFTVNGKTRLVRGSAGEGAQVKLNKKNANLHSPIEQNDVIEIKESTVGEPASVTIGQLEEFNSEITFIVNDKKVVCPRFAYVNGELKSEFYDINNGDKIRMENFYTVEQLFEFLDLDYKTLNVMVNNEPASKNTKVYENFTVKTLSLEEYNNALRQANEAARNEASDEYEYDEDESAEDIETAGEAPESETSAAGETEAKSGHGRKDRKRAGESAAAKEQKQEETRANIELHIAVNGQAVTLTGKPEYVVVDLFQFYEFDLTKVRGDLVFKHNGEDAEYSSPLNDGDVIELRWEEVKK